MSPGLQPALSQCRDVPQLRFCSLPIRPRPDAAGFVRRYMGKSVLKAVENINTIIAPALKVGSLDASGVGEGEPQRHRPALYHAARRD